MSARLVIGTAVVFVDADSAFLQLPLNAFARDQRSAVLAGEQATREGVVDGGESVAKDLWDLWGSKTPEDERREAIKAVAKATPEELRSVIEPIVIEVAAQHPEKQPALQALLPQIQANIRRTLRRPADPTGTTSAPWQ